MRARRSLALAGAAVLGSTLLVTTGTLLPATRPGSPGSAYAASSSGQVVAAVPDPNGGYWEVTTNGSVFAYAGALYYGSLPGEKVKTTLIVGMCPTQDAKGYWLLGSSGRVYPFGDATPLGNASAGAAAILPDGVGYRVIYSNGKSAVFPVPYVPRTIAGAGPTVAPATLFPRSLFNQSVTTWPLSPASASLVANFVADYKADYGGVNVGTSPIYYVGKKTPLVHVSVTSGCNSFVQDTGARLPIPSFAALNGSSDNPITIYQPSSATEWELWKLARTASGYEACWGGKLDMATSTGVFAYPWGRSATGISYLATTITEADVAAGYIYHAVAITVDRCNAGTYPADRYDCGNDPGQPAEGQWFRFAPGTAMPKGLTPFAQMVFRAISTYGMVVIDRGGAFDIAAEQQSDWAAEGQTGIDPITASWEGLQEYRLLATMPWGDLQVVTPPHR